MAALSLHLSDIPSLDGKIVILTGGSSGIGLAAALIFASKGAKVHVLDVTPIDRAFDIFEVPGQTSDSNELGNLLVDDLEFHLCDVTYWAQLRSVFDKIGRVDIAIANAGVSEDTDYFADVLNVTVEVKEPHYSLIDVNYRSVLNFVKLSLNSFVTHGTQGSIVITSSATAYSPEQSLPAYSATKLALVGLIRSLRPSMSKFGATINGVAPAATVSKLLPKHLAAPIMQAGAPVSSSYHVGLALAYSTIATQPRQVEAYGRDDPTDMQLPGRWNGRVILTLGDRWTEVEEPLAALRSQWLGEWNTEKTALQQKLTDMR